jgi:hypothetical protein
MSSALLLLFYEHNIKIICSCSYNPQSQGLVKQENCTAIDQIEMWKVDNSSNYLAEILPTISLAINSTQHTITWKTPFQVVFRDPNFTTSLPSVLELYNASVTTEDGSVFTQDNDLVLAGSSVECEMFLQSVGTPFRSGWKKSRTKLCLSWWMVHWS